MLLKNIEYASTKLNLRERARHLKTDWSVQQYYNILHWSIFIYETTICSHGHSIINVKTCEPIAKNIMNLATSYIRFGEHAFSQLL